MKPRHSQYSSQAWTRSSRSGSRTDWQLPSAVAPEHQGQTGVWTTQDLWLLRQELGLSREEMASRLGHVDTTAIRSWESGESCPSARDNRLLVRMLVRASRRSAKLRVLLNRVRPSWRAMRSI